jgi:uncharacterized repeat protein (TIGR02543 family)
MTGFNLNLDSSGQFSTSSLVNGKVYAADYTAPTPATLTTAVLDMQAAYTDASGRPTNVTELGAGNIDGMTLAPGVYKWSTGVTIPNNVTLSGGPNDVWVFEIAGVLSTGVNSSVILTGGAQAQNVYWAVAGNTALGANSAFNGNILDYTNIALGNGATLNGRALAQTAVTLIGDTITIPSGISSVNINGFVAPATGAMPASYTSLTPGSATYTVTRLTWSPTDIPYKASTNYTATVVLTSASGYTFPSGGLTPTVNTGTPAAGTTTGNTLTFTVAFPATAAPATYTVTYAGNGNTSGTVPTDSSSPYASGATVTVLGNTGTLARTGYTFNNWNTQAGGGGTSYAPAATFSIAANTVLYAQWTAVPSVSPVSLGTAANFGVLSTTFSGSAVNSYIIGDVGATTNTYAGHVNGTIHGADSALTKAQTDLTNAITDANGRTGATALPQELGGLTLTPGVYHVSSIATIETGNLYLNPGTNGTTAVWIFQVPTSITTTGTDGVILTNGAQANNTYWSVGTATIGNGPGAGFNGTILASTAITLQGVTLNGRALAPTVSFTTANNATNPSPSADTSADGMWVNMTFSRAMNDPSSYKTEFDVSGFGIGSYGIQTATLDPTDPTKIDLYLLNYIRGSQQVTVTYSGSDVTYRGDGALAPFTQPVVNNSVR